MRRPIAGGRTRQLHAWAAAQHGRRVARRAPHVSNRRASGAVTAAAVSPALSGWRKATVERNDDEDEIALSRPPFPCCRHQLRRSLVFPIQPEPTRYRGVVARARCRGHGRNDPLPVRQIQRCIRPMRQSSTTQARHHLASGRDVRDAARRAVSVVACSRRAWRRTRRAGAKASGSSGFRLPSRRAMASRLKVRSAPWRQSGPTFYGVYWPVNAGRADADRLHDVIRFGYAK